MIDHFLFDLDGTVTTEELLPLIAKACGIAEQMEALTASTIAGDIPFAHSLRRRVELLRSVPVSVVQNIANGVGLHPYIREFINQNRNRCTIVTGNLDIWLEPIRDKLGVPMISSLAKTRNDMIEDLYHVLDKGDATAKFKGNICAIGDGNNDFGMISRSRIGIAYGGVHEPAKSLLEVAHFAVYDGKALCRLLSQL